MTNQFSCFNNNLNGLLPLENIIDEVITINGCDFIIRPRTEKGWTIDIVFNANGYDWSNDNVFYYLGIKDELLPENYLDNNLSFWLTSDRKIKWKTYKYISESQNKLIMGNTESICTGITSDDFNITITFNRDNEYENCNLLNEGGVNDQIVSYEVTNGLSVLSGDSETYNITYGLDKKWLNESKKRQGTLKIYINGKVFYKVTAWEEIIPSQRNSTNKLIQTWGTGTTGCNNYHNGNCDIEIKEINYYEEPLTYLQINKILQSKTYNFNPCDECNSAITSI